VINVSGHRIGTAEVEGALALNAHVAEAAVVGVEHAIKGTSLYAFVTLVAGAKPSDELRQQLIMCVQAGCPACVLAGLKFSPCCWPASHLLQVDRTVVHTIVL
jgi:acyl-coenzyme A synthetase/AMP-(fatty) acid ligase